MGHPRVARLYRAALLGYLLAGGEDKLARAHDIGREAIENGVSLLDILRAHHRAVNGLLEFTGDSRRSLERIEAAEDFLMEALSAFDMMCRSYVDLVSNGEPQVRPFPSRSRDITR